MGVNVALTLAGSVLWGDSLTSEPALARLYDDNASQGCRVINTCTILSAQKCSFPFHSSF